MVSKTNKCQQNVKVQCRDMHGMLLFCSALRRDTCNFIKASTYFCIVFTVSPNNVMLGHCHKDIILYANLSLYFKI